MAKEKDNAIKAPYINREYSWLQFDRRVLDQARNPDNPLLERCRFLSIFISNLDEFVRVRLGSLVNLELHSPGYIDNKTGMNARDQINMILNLLPGLYKKSDETFSKLRRELKSSGVDIIMHNTITETQKVKALQYFQENVIPFLSPLVLDAKHPMIRFENQRLYLVLRLERDGREMFGVVSMGMRIEPLIRIGGGKKVKLLPAEEMLYLFGDTLFPGTTIKEKSLLRVTRNADFEATVEDADIEYDFDFSKLIRNRIESRGSLAVVRLEMNTQSDELKQFLIKHLGIKKNQVFMVEGSFSYKYMFDLDRFFPLEERTKLRYPAFKGSVPAGLERGVMIDTVLKRDVFLSYPFQSMDPLLWLLEECADDPRVSNIKITIYRLAKNSRIVASLVRAAENGKDVSVVMELCARFDEESNLSYARELQEAGCTVFYGIENYKVHSKIISIVLRDNGKIRYITHLGTGNYNESTAKQYTDLNIITSDREIGLDGVAFFRNLATLTMDYKYRRLLVAPETLKSGLVAEMDKEIAKGPEGSITCKMNSLSDKELIDKLVEASNAGVRIRLLIRGISCLLPGVPGLTENIEIMSIVGRFLEHSRIYYFGSGSMYISSADLMTRNIDRRVEIATPVLDPKIKKTIAKMLEIMFEDHAKGRTLSNEGHYSPLVTSDDGTDSQKRFLEMYRGGKNYL